MGRGKSKRAGCRGQQSSHVGTPRRHTGLGSRMQQQQDTPAEKPLPGRERVVSESFQNASRTSLGDTGPLVPSCDLIFREGSGQRPWQ